MCGGDLNIQPEMTVAECLYCGSKQTIPNISDEKKATLYDRAGYYRRNNDYDKAMSIYEQLIVEDNTDAEAHWSAVLCRYGIEYVEDPRSHRRIPTVNRAQYKSILNDPDYQVALRNADSSQYDLYQQEALLIDRIQRGILEVSRREEPFDIFICYKETDNQGRRTQDSVIAYDIYKELTKEGYRVFFARVTLEDKLGTAYEPYIFAALNSAKIMLVVGTSPENFQAVWVKNEWSRYLALMQENDKILIPVYKDMSPYEMPEEFSYLQSQDYGKLGAMQDIVHGVDKIIGTKSNNSQNKVTNTATSTTDNTGALLERAYQFIEEGKWEEAEKYYNRVLDINPKCSNAYLIAAMVDTKAKDRQEIVEFDGKIEKNENFLKAIRYGNYEEKKYLDDIISESRSVYSKKQYKKALELIKSDKESQINEAYTIFKDLNSTYNDMSKEIESCSLLIEKIRRKKKVKIRIVISCCILMVCTLVGIEVYPNMIRPKILYKKVLKYEDNNQFDEALELCNDNRLENKDDIIYECKYKQADYYFRNKEYDKSIIVINELLGKEYNTEMIDMDGCSTLEMVIESLEKASTHIIRKNIDVTEKLSEIVESKAYNKVEDYRYLLNGNEYNIFRLGWALETEDKASVKQCIRRVYDRFYAREKKIYGLREMLIEVGYDDETVKKAYDYLINEDPSISVEERNYYKEMRKQIE